MHDWSILSTPSDMILDRVRRREIVSGVFIIARNNEPRRLYDFMFKLLIYVPSQIGLYICPKGILVDSW